LDLGDTRLGKTTVYKSEYDASLLCPLERQHKRDELGVGVDKLPFVGVDVWNSYEISWLDVSGRPAVALGEFVFPAESRFIVESKSFKLYLNSFNQTKFKSIVEVCACIEKDLTHVVALPVKVSLWTEQTIKSTFGTISALDLFDTSNTEFTCIDAIDAGHYQYQTNPDLLHLSGAKFVTKQLYSNLLKSNCPVTGQPDWATLIIRYTGAEIDKASLLRYIVSYRQHQDFHEQCVERIFIDLMTRCQCQSLSVYARYTRRGGLDINPYRATSDLPRVPENERLIRQ